MGLATELGYRHRSPNQFQRLTQVIASTRPGAWVFAKVLRHLDDAATRLSRGRLSAPEVLAGLPVLDLTTTGRKSGSPRASHLISIPVGDDLAVIGSNFGQTNTPAWVLNLEAEPRATVVYKQRTVAVVARPASEDEARDVMERSRAIYGGYEKYVQRISGRRVRIFVLEPA
jgi:deazaflavin-dependent oxidoreductase (nitroreductase family)